MADLKLVGAVAVKVRPDTKGFLGETKRGVTEALRTYNPEVEVDAEVDVDTGKADRQLGAFERKHDGKVLNMRVRVDHDSLRAARDKVADRLKDFDKHHNLKFKADEEGLRGLQKKLDDLARKAKVEVNFVGDEDGYRSILRKIERIRSERDLATTMRFKTDDESLRRAELKARKALERLDKAKTVTLEYGNDRTSLQGAIREVEQRIAKLHHITLDTKLNKTSLAAARAELRRQLKDAEYKVRFVRDEDGYRGVLAQIKKIRDEQHKTSEWKFKTDKASLAQAEKDALEALKKIEANRTIEIRYTNDYDGLRAVRARLDAELAKAKEVKIKTKLDEAGLQAARDKIDAKLQDAKVTVQYNDDAAGYEAVLERIKQIRREKALVEIKFKTDDDSLAAEQARIQGLLDATPHGIELKLKLDEAAKRKAEHEAKQLQDKIDDMKASIEVGVHTGGAAAQLAYTSRSRIVDFYVKVNKKSLIVAEGLLKSLSGINTLNSAGRMLESLFVRFDKIALMTAGIATVIGSLVDVALYATSALVSIGGGVAQVVGLFAAAPAIISALTAGVVVYIAAFKNFKGAIDGNAEAMAALPPAAAAAATALQGVWTAIQQPIQTRFWDGMGTSIQDAVTRGLDPLKEGLADTGEAFGKFTAGILNSFSKIAENGDLSRMFGHLNEGMHNLSQASEPFFDAFNKLGFEGSKFLPRFGTWMTDLATTFDKWITRSRDAGAITEWIEHGVNSLTNMWGVAGSTINMFKALTRAANDAGATGLAGFAIRMQNIADMMLSEPWQSQMSTIFEGAREGAGHLNQGFKTLSGTIGDSAVWVGKLLTQFGLLGGGMLEALTLVTGHNVFQSGTMKGLEGMAKMLDDLGPAFLGLGSIIGNLSVVAGSIFGSIGHTIGAVVKLLDESVAIMLDNVSEIAPRLLGSVQTIVTAITPTILALVTGLNAVLGFVNDMPGGIALAAGALGAFLALRGLFSHFYKAFANTKVFQNMQGQWLRQEAAAGRTRTAFRMVNGELQKFTVPTGKFSAARTAFSGAAGAARNLGTHVDTVNRAMNAAGVTSNLQRSLGLLSRTAIPAARSALGGLMGALGGPWGAALALAGIGVALFAQSQQKAKAAVDSLSAAVDKQSGTFTDAGMEQLAKQWTDLDEAGSGFANFWRGAVKGMESADVTAGKLKLNIASVTEAIAKGGPEYEKLVGNLDNLATAMEEAGSVQRSSNIEKAANALGLTNEQLVQMGVNANDVRHLTSNIQESGNQANIAKAVYEGLGNATGNTSIHAQKMAEAMALIGDESQTAASKIDAIRTALDLLKGGAQSARQAQVESAKATQSAVEQAAGLHDEIAAKLEAGGALIDGTTGLLDQTSTTGVQLFEAMDAGAKGVLIGAQAAYQAAIEAKKTPEEAMDLAMSAMGKSQGVLEEIAKSAGVSAETLKAEWDGFFGNDWELRATFSASAEHFEAVRNEVVTAGLDFNQTTWQAMLDADVNPAKMSVEEARVWGENYARTTWTSRIDALNPEAMAAIAEAVGAGDAYKAKDYTAVIKALNNAGLGTDAAWTTIQGLTGHDHEAVVKAFNNTGPGTLEAWQQIMSVTGVDYYAAIQALADPTAANGAAAVLDGIANKQRIAWIEARSSSGDPFADAGLTPGMSRGAILDRFGKGLGGFNPQMVKAFATGGISVEQPGTAKIYSPASKYRIFAEPSTGGESYIPLSAKNRSRSVSIWEETGRRLGVQQFARGGITGAASAGRSAPTINVTNNYPVPEKTSTTINRSLQFAAAIDPS